MKFYKNQKGGIVLWVLILVILASIMLVGGSSLFNFNDSIPPNNGQAVNIQDTQPATISPDTLQIQELKGTIPSPTPIPSTACNHDNGQPAQVNDGKPVSDPNCICPQFLVECKNKLCVSVTDGPNKNPDVCAITYGWCGNQSLTGGIDGVFCLGKPVIYLYPEKDTLVNVTLNTPGKIVESIPLYPKEGWQNILAHKGGSLDYQGKKYNELYYESSVNNVSSPKNGIVVGKEQIEPELKLITAKLGLIGNEQKEFLAYWMPKLKDLNSKYLFISVIDTKEKEEIDNVLINPEPTTRIEFLMYFKPVDKFFIPPVLTLSNNPPKRIGFTEVEWGGTISGN
jgi:hypothetical protein